MTIASFTPSATKPRSADADSLYVTSCKLGGHGIYKGQSWVWLPTPIGISHTACAYRYGRLAHPVGARVVYHLPGERPEPGVVYEVVYARAGGVWEYDIRLDDGRCVTSQPRNVRAAP